MPNTTHPVLFSKSKGFATYDTAVQKGHAIIDASCQGARWIVVALPSGRFLPVVIASNDAQVNMPHVASKGCGVVN